MSTVARIIEKLVAVLETEDVEHRLRLLYAVRPLLDAAIEQDRKVAARDPRVSALRASEPVPVDVSLGLLDGD